MEEIMNEKEEFFSPKHKQLLNIATWAKYIAWIALVISFILPVANFFGSRNLYQSAFVMNGQRPDFMNELRTNPSYAITLIINALNDFLRGFICYLVLRGISLGLNMIVETDINYREQKQQGGA
jgi:hypothetical protein